MDGNSFAVAFAEDSRPDGAYKLVCVCPITLLNYCNTWSRSEYFNYVNQSHRNPQPEHMYTPTLVDALRFFLFVLCSHKTQEKQIKYK